MPTAERAAYSITYQADYHYSEPVTEQHNALRIRPTQDSRQSLDGFDIAIEPGARIYEHRDYYGTDVIQFAIGEAHDRLSIRAESRVSVGGGPAGPDPGWEALDEPGYLDAGAEFLGPLDPAADPERIEGLLAEVDGGSPAATLAAVCDLIPSRFEYRPGVTYVGSTVDDLLAGGAGVCQDFVHLALTMLRARGIAARYVSGYLFAPAGEDGDGASAEVDTHAWLEALLPGDGVEERAWVAVDPTNRKAATSDHVKIGHGRSYADVPPIRGVYRGGAESEVEVGVRMLRIGAGGQ